jgi:hypothetical protein
MAYNSMLSGHPCLTELLTGKGCDRKPFICIADVALLYIFLMRRRNCSLCPCLLSVSNKYSWEILSKAYLKSIDKMHSAVPDTSAYATASRIVAIASRIMVSDSPQC